jgi:hypothetical protein
MPTLQQDRRAPANHEGELDQKRENPDGEGGAGYGERNVEQGLEGGDHAGFPNLVLGTCRTRRINEQDSDDAE